MKTPIRQAIMVARATKVALFPLFAPAVIATLLVGCASVGHLATPSGKPEVRIPKSLFRRAPAAITSYNLSKGRELDRAKPEELVTYESVKTSTGTDQITRKFVYDLLPASNDSVVIMSKQVATNDLDDDDASEDAAQPSLEAQQQELEQIVRLLVQQAQLDHELENAASNNNADQAPTR